MTNLYPTWRYHPDLEGRIVKNPEQEEKETPASDGWRDTPYPAKPKLEPGNKCKNCARLQSMFDASWADKTKECDALKKKYDALIEEYKALEESAKKGK